MESEGREPYGVQYTSSTFLSHEGHYLFQSNALCILSDFVNAAAFCFICSLQTGCRNHFVDREDVEESLEWHFKRCSLDICWDAKWCFPLVSRPPVKKVVRPYQVRVYHIRERKTYSGSIFETRLSLGILCTILVKYTTEMTSKCSNLKWNSRRFRRKLHAGTEKNKLRYHFVLSMAFTFIDHSSRPISASELTQLLKKAIWCFLDIINRVTNTNTAFTLTKHV